VPRLGLFQQRRGIFIIADERIGVNMIACDPQSLANAAQQFECCLPDGLNRYAQTYLLAQILAALVPGTSTDPSVIANQARCFDCGFGNELAMQTFLMCQIVTALGG
jgi:hypothetical protein